MDLVWLWDDHCFIRFRCGSFFVGRPLLFFTGRPCLSSFTGGGAPIVKTTGVDARDTEGELSADELNWLGVDWLNWLGIDWLNWLGVDWLNWLGLGWLNEIALNWLNEVVNWLNELGLDSMGIDWLVLNWLNWLGSGLNWLAFASNGTPDGNELGPEKGTRVGWFEPEPEAKKPGAVNELLDAGPPECCPKGPGVDGWKLPAPWDVWPDDWPNPMLLEVDLLFGGLTSIWQSWSLSLGRVCSEAPAWDDEGSFTVRR